jgi:NTP pyrophosphatase (non-canonical NTP hydrolase)
MTFEEYEEAASKTAIYPGRGSEIGLVYVGLKMNGEAGEFAEHLGKAQRDDNFTQVVGDSRVSLTEDRRDLLIKEVGDVLWYLSAAAHDLGTSLSEIAQINIEKLRDRANRNALQGSGDNR